MGENVKHTPGPWVLDGHNLSTVLHCTAERGSEAAKHICGDYETVARCEGDNWSANARLIAAAPELLETLKRIQRLSDRCGDLPDTEGLRRAYRDIDVAARAAIAKAESRP